MNDLIKNENGTPVVSSRKIATHFEKRHNDVVLAIENKVKVLTTENFVVEKYFMENTFLHNGNQYKEYLLTRDGFSFIVMGFTGAKADIWKLKYIESFNRMEREIKSYPLKATSVGEVTNFLKHMDKIMLAQRSSPAKRTEAFEFVSIQFGVELPEKFVEPSYEQVVFTITD